MSYTVAMVVDKKQCRKRRADLDGQANGTGPFKLKEYVRGQRLILARNDNYYRDPKPQLDEVSFVLGGGSAMTM